MITLLVVAGIICLVYYAACAVYAGVSSSYLWIWLIGGLLCLAGAFFLYLEKDGTVSIGFLPELKIILMIVFLLFFILFCVVEGKILGGMKSSEVQNLDYLIVLGAQVKNGHPTRALHWRIGRACEYLSKNPNTKAVLSGGQGPDESISEADCMFEGLTGLGIAPDRLIMENKSTNTDENFQYSLGLIDRNVSIGVVTSNFHVYRSCSIGKKISGRKLAGIPAPVKDLMLPHYMVREFLAVIKDLLTGHMDW